AAAAGTQAYLAAPRAEKRHCGCSAEYIIAICVWSRRRFAADPLVQPGFIDYRHSGGCRVQYRRSAQFIVLPAVAQWHCGWYARWQCLDAGNVGGTSAPPSKCAASAGVFPDDYVPADAGFVAYRSDCRLAGAVT